VMRQLFPVNDVVSLAALEDRLLRFQTHYEQVAKPFEWADVTPLLAKLAAREALAPAA
jgi:hypothetical protein